MVYLNLDKLLDRRKLLENLLPLERACSLDFDA